MRELKFRCWGIKENKYLKLHSIHLSTSKVIVSYYGVGGGNISIALKDVVLEQYTGLKDKNGKEIYEGDIVKDTSDGDCLINAIFWCEKGGFWGVKPRSPFADRDWGWFIGREDVEVIGNIHENKELLNVQ